MTDVDNAGLVAAAIVVAVLLIGLPFYAGTFGSGYASPSYFYEHEIEAGPADNVTGELELDGGTSIEDITYAYTGLSPTAQRLFERTLNAESREYTPTVCKNYVFVCDGYYEQDLPSEFTYGAGGGDEFRYSIIESDDGQYLLRTGVLGSASGEGFGEALLVYFLRGLMLLHGGAITAATAVRLSDRWAGPDGLGYTALVGTGALFTVLGYITPYLQMYGGIEYIVFLLATVAVAAIGYIYGSFIWLLSRW